MAWTYAAKRSDLEHRDVIGVTCQGRRVALYRLGDDVLATSDMCPHLGASLSQGCVVDGFVECPAHFGLFDIRTGAADGGVTTRAGSISASWPSAGGGRYSRSFRQFR